MDERKDFLGCGWALPLALDPRTGRLAVARHEDDIRQAIRIILETRPGERLMRPEFGCGIHDLVFTHVDSTALQRVRSVVEEALRQFEPRIDVLDIDADLADGADGRLDVQIAYRVRKTNQTSNLVYPFFFREGGRA